MFKIGFYVPEEHLAAVKEAMFSSGAGKIGNYDKCCWRCLGEGQFRPNSGSDPFIGEQGVVEVVPEYRVEMVCDDQYVRKVIAAMKASHPYEEPAYDVSKLEAF